MRLPAGRAWTLVGAWVFAAAAGAAAAQPPPDEDLRSEVVRLRREHRVAEVELDRLRQVIARLEAELAAARQELAGRAEPDAGAAAAAPEDAASALAAVPPAVEEEDLSDEELGEPTQDDDPAEAEPEPADEEPEVVSEAARTLYDQSYTFFHEKRYRESEQGFQRFLDLYPQGSLADNAQFWIGECRFARGEYDSALDAFMATVERYPDGNKVPDALYKAGRSLESLGDRVRARATYEEVARLFPSSAAALAARERLANL